jgi:hypothetical protein
MENKKPLKVIEFFLEDEESENVGSLNLISLVKEPAIERESFFFKKEEIQQNFSFIEDKQIIVGPAMTPNKNILRKNKNDEYFYCYFSEETVEKCAQYLFKNNNHVKMNLEHGEIKNESELSNVYIYQSWIVKDPEKDTSLFYGFKPIKGELFVVFKVEDKKEWDFIKKNEFTGFSIEGNFLYERFDKIEQEEEMINQIKSIILKDLSDEEKEKEIKKIIIK